MSEPLDVMRTVVFADDASAPHSGAPEATVTAGSLPLGFAVVHPRFAERLTSEHVRWFELEVSEKSELTRDLPNVGEEALTDLDERGLVKVGAKVSSGSILVGVVAPREGAAFTPEEKLLRAIFGEKASDVVDRSLRAPAWCSGTVTVSEFDGRRARVQVSWSRRLEPGDVLELDGRSVVVTSIAPVEADLASAGSGSRARVTKRSIAREVLEARSIGPYDATTQQPEFGRDSRGGQRLEAPLAEVLGAHAPWMLWECMTLKSDDVISRTRAYESVVRQENPAKDVTEFVAPGEAKPLPSPPAPSAAPRDIFSFFEKPRPAEFLPDGVVTLRASLEAMGFDVRLTDAAPRVGVLGEDELRRRSHGQVKAGELGSQKIFGPERDYECACGKYKRMKHRGVVCEQCGVEVLQSKVRRERFGHLELPGPCTHPLTRERTMTLLPVLPAGLRAEPLDELYGRLLAAERVAAAQSALDDLFTALAESVENAWSKLHGKTVDYSGRAALTLDPSLSAGRCRVPIDVLFGLFAPHAYGALEAAGYTTTIKSSKRLVDQRSPVALQAIGAVSEGMPVLLANGGRAVGRVVTAWDAPAIGVDAETYQQLEGGPVQLFAPISTQAILELASFPEVPMVAPSAASGWLNEAWRAGSLMAFVVRAASTGERQEVLDPVLRGALGRPPPPPAAETIARWEGERVERLAKAMRPSGEGEAAQTKTPPNWDLSIDELEVSVRTANALATLKLQTVGELCQRTESDLLKTTNFGRQSLKEVKELLAELGLSLGMRG